MIFHCGLALFRAVPSTAQLATTMNVGGLMLFNSTRFRIDPTPRRADRQYVAHVRIITILVDGAEREVHASGDMAAFERRDDAVAYATKWAEGWLTSQFG